MNERWVFMTWKDQMEKVCKEVRLSVEPTFYTLVHPNHPYTWSRLRASLGISTMKERVCVLCQRLLSPHPKIEKGAELKYYCTAPLRTLGFSAATYWCDPCCRAENLLPFPPFAVFRTVQIRQ
jgi:hypothetical protein